MYKLICLLILASFAVTTGADLSKFSKGPVLNDFGPVAEIRTTMVIPANAVFKHSFDTGTAAPDGEPNKTLVSTARFINMHARVGVARENLHAAVVVHGKAVKEVADEASSSAKLVSALIDQGARIIVCGQSAVYHGVATDELLPGVEMALSAMTAHALLQQQGYTLNPF